MATSGEARRHSHTQQRGWTSDAQHESSHGECRNAAAWEGTQGNEDRRGGCWLAVYDDCLLRAVAAIRTVPDRPRPQQQPNCSKSSTALFIVGSRQRHCKGVEPRSRSVRSLPSPPCCGVIRDTPITHSQKPERLCHAADRGKGCSSRECNASMNWVVGAQCSLQRTRRAMHQKLDANSVAVQKRCGSSYSARNKSGS